MDDREFGRLVRQWRDRVEPAAVGMSPGAHRRAQGLRREELAQLAGISVDYLTRLEQGRATSPSAQVVEALARALRVSDNERERLFRGAGLSVPGPGVVPTRIAPSVQRLLDRLANTPVVVYDAAWNLIQANAPFDALMGATSQLRGNDRNAVLRNVAGSGSRARHTPEEQARQNAGLVADLRMTVARYPDDGRLRRLVDDLRGQSPTFRELWTSATDAPTAEPSRHKIIDHPLVGAIELDCDVLVVTDDDLRIMVYTAEPGSEGAQKLELAVVLGSQELAGQG
nr:helix-turn-helix transcriptional regulator [Microbacterium bovistercoris]